MTLTAYSTIEFRTQRLLRTPLPTPPEEHPQSFVEYVQIVEKYQMGSDEPLWYRGVEKTGFRLMPSLYRHKDTKSVDGFVALEKDVIARFAQRSLPYVKQAPADAWQQLFLMQHYGFPTRLLDWSENPFIALFFSVMGTDFKAVGKPGARVFTYSSDAVVWVLNPVLWNRQALSHQSFAGKVISQQDKEANAYKPPLDTFDDRNAAIALNGAHNSERIVAQRGAFTIFGGCVDAMDKVYEDRKFIADTLVKITLDKSVIPTLRKAVHNYGFSESVVYPGLDGLAKETKRILGFED